MTFKLKQDKDTIRVTANTEVLSNLPLKVFMKTLEIFKKNHSLSGSYFEYDKKTSQLISENKEAYENEKSLETKAFKKLSKVYFDNFNSPIYAYNSYGLIEYIKRVYDVEPLLNNFKVEEVDEIVYKINIMDGEKVLSIKNLDSLMEKYGKKEVLHSLILFKENLAFKEKINTKQIVSYKLSTEILTKTFNEKKQTHERLDRFKDKDYFFELVFNQQMNYADSPEEILGLVLIREQLRKKIENSKEIEIFVDKKGSKYHVLKESHLDLKNKKIEQDEENSDIKNINKNYFYKEKQLHREDGPAIETFDGTKEWYKKGKLHRENGPAIEYSDGDKFWYINNKLHREDGPAIEYESGYKEYWLNGNKISEEKFYLQREITDNLISNNESKKNKI